MSNPRISIFIQARSNSERLPGKIYRGVPNEGGLPILEMIYRRLLCVRDVDSIAVLIPQMDERLAEWCRERRIPYFCGPENDVRKRFQDAALEFGSDLIVRATGDNPFVDPDIAYDTILEMQRREVDLLSFSNLPTGIAVEIFTKDALFRNIDDNDAIFQEHVTLHIKHNMEKFRILHLDHPLMDYFPSDLPRLTVDTLEDLQVARNVAGELPWNLSLSDLLNLYRLKPELFLANRDVQQRIFLPRVAL